MRVNIFVGIEGTHQLIGDLFESHSTVASPKMAMFIGPDARSHKSDSIEELTAFLFEGEINEEYNIAVSRVGADGPLLRALLTNCPTGTRVFFFKLEDPVVAKQYQLRYLSSSSDNVVERVTGLEKAKVSDAIDSILAEGTAMVDAVATKFEAEMEWVNFGESNYFDGPAPAESPIKVRILVK